MNGPYAHSGDVVSVQRCAFGDDVRGYCGARAVEHLWVEVDSIPEGAQSMACAEHQGRVDWPVRDRHPVDGPCGLPGATWRHSHPSGGPGWCELEGIDWLAAAEVASAVPDVRFPAMRHPVRHGGGAVSFLGFYHQHGCECGAHGEQETRDART